MCQINKGKVNNKVSVQYLYQEKKLRLLGENFYGATQRIKFLPINITQNPEFSAKIDKYILEQVENRNYMQINPYKHRKDTHQDDYGQLHVPDTGLRIPT